MAQTSQILVSLPRDAIYSLKPDASSIDGDFAVFDVNTSMSYACDISNRLNHISPVDKPLSIGIAWRDAFRYRERLLALGVDYY